MPRQRSPDRDKAKEIYLQSGGTVKLRDIARQLGIPEKTVSAWKAKDRWDGKSNGVLRKNKEYSEQKKKADKAVLRSVEKNDELTEKEKQFCVYYVRTFNATQAAIRAGYSPKTAYSIGYNLLHIPKVRAEVERLKAIKAEAILAGPEDVVEKMMHIAFADMSWFTKFSGGSVTLRPDAEVDGTLIREVSEGRDGVKIKLLDPQRALEWLGRYFLLNPLDRHRVEFENKKLALEQKDEAGQPNAENMELASILEQLKKAGKPS